jgi:hypothetical protein
LFRFLISIFVGLSLVVISGYFYYFRLQTIELKFIPTEFEYCNSIITVDDAQYQKLVIWLEANQSGWSVDWNTPVAGNIYRNSVFSVSVFRGGVSVGYKTDDGYPRFIKSVDHGLDLECSDDS